MDETKDCAKRMHDNLKELPMVKSLSLSDTIMVILCLDDDYNLPMFYNLVHIDLHIEICGNWSLLLKLFKSMPNLKILELSIVNLDICDEDFSDEEEFISVASQEVLTCVLSHLKEVEASMVFPMLILIHCGDAASLSSKRQKSQNHRNEEDRISRLPDEILSLLLSFLPTKDAVSTGILSKRWGTIWTSVPDLDFHEADIINPDFAGLFPDKFINIVDSVLNLRDNFSPVVTFHLACCLRDPSPIISWIYYAIAHGVREIDLSFMVPTLDPIELPQSLFTSEKLEVLKLHTSIHVQNPDSICLPSLRVLHLTWLFYDSGSIIENFISNCPVLEELVIERNYKDSLDHLVINSCSLKCLEIHANMNRNLLNECNVVVDAPNLESVDLSHCLSGSYVMKSELPLLIEANINVVQLDGEDPSYQHNLFALLRAISSVRYLELSEDTMNNLGLSMLNLANPITMPEFGKLTHLEVKIGRFGWLILPKLLECLPHLKDFVFHNHPVSEICMPPSMPDYQLKCLSSLENIEIVAFDRCEAEIELVKYFLRYARALKKLTIHSRYMGLEEEMLIEFPRSSKSCKVAVLPDYHP